MRFFVRTGFVAGFLPLLLLSPPPSSTPTSIFARAVDDNEGNETNDLLYQDTTNHSNRNRKRDSSPGDYDTRRAQYLEQCSTNSRGIAGQACKAYLGIPHDDKVGDDENDKHHRYLYRAIRTIETKSDGADLALNAVLRTLLFDKRQPSLSDKLRSDMTHAALHFKYWYDEPGHDNNMCFWSENHQILFATAEYIAGHVLFNTNNNNTEITFPNSGMTGQQHAAKALPRIERWLDYRFRFGFSEWHSNKYFEYDIPALLNLIDFCGDDNDDDDSNGLATRATMVMDIMAMDMAMNYYKGMFATAHGRTYIHNPDYIRDGTKLTAWMLFGFGDATGHMGKYGASFLATSDNYKLPLILQHIAEDAQYGGGGGGGIVEHKQRDGIFVEDAPLYGIGFRELDDIMFWWGMEAYFAPKVIQGSFALLNHLNVWNDNFWLRQLLWPLGHHPPLLSIGASAVEDLSLGLALESASTYTYRTPNYQLSGVQDYKPGGFAGQVLSWVATLDDEAYVFTTYPGGSSHGSYAAGNWTGGFLPRVTMHKNVAVIQYRRRPIHPVVDHAGIFVEYTHAYFPKYKFDEVVESGENHWVIGRKGLGYVALWSRAPTHWSSDRDGELVANSKENVWIVELGDRDSDGEFSDFVASIEAANISITKKATTTTTKRSNGEEVIRYESPSQGTVTVGWEGPMTVAGKQIDLGPYPRWDNAYAHQDFNTKHLVISYEDEELELDFEHSRRVLHSTTIP